MEHSTPDDAEALKAQVHNQLRTVSRIDPVTGLPAGTAILSSLDPHPARLSAAGIDLSLVICDIDSFKQVNDEHGHLVGDRVLAAVASTFKREARNHDLVTRYGGDEFLFVLMDAGLHLARAWADLARTALHETRMRPASWAVTASFGVATHNPPETTSSLLDRADRAMYRAKTFGGDRVEVDPGT